MRLLLATGNRGKVAEMAAILGAPGLELVTLADFPALRSPVEDGETFLQNALIKARAGAAGTGLPTIGEDSGLVVDALGGAPGVRSARYAEGGDRARCEKLLAALAGVPPARRSARFVCVAALALPDGREELAEGICEGAIATMPRGSGGFGYDPVFLLPDGRTMAELEPREKDAVSHRGKALRALAPWVRGIPGAVPSGKDGA